MLVHIRAGTDAHLRLRLAEWSARVTGELEASWLGMQAHSCADLHAHACSDLCALFLSLLHTSQPPRPYSTPYAVLSVQI